MYYFLVILQARMDSSRLPGKVLKKASLVKLYFEIQCQRILMSKKNQ